VKRREVGLTDRDAPSALECLQQELEHPDDRITLPGGFHRLWTPTSIFQSIQLLERARDPPPDDLP
jgi:hypothetical protein